MSEAGAGAGVASAAPPRVLMITPGYPPAVGGAEIQCARLSEALAARGVEVRVVTRGLRNTPRDETRAAVAIRRSWPGREGRGTVVRLARALAYLRHVASQVHAIAGEPGWVIHHHGLGVGLVAARLAAGRRSPPIVAKVLCGGIGGECARLSGEWMFWPVRRVLRHVDRFVALVPSIGDELAGLGVPSSRVAVVPNGVALPPATEAEEPSVPAEPLTVLFGGRLDPQKDLSTLLEAWRRVTAAAPAARLVLAGDGPERSSLTARRAALGLAESIELPGFVADYPSRLARCAVFVLPSRFEGMSNALLEAMAAARACVASDLPENRHTLADAGRYFAPGDAHALAEQLIELLGSAAERVRLGARARRRTEDRFALGAVADRYLALYRELLAR